MGVLVAGLIIVGLVLAVISLITFFNLVTFTSELWQSMSWAPDWIAGGGVGVWLLSLVVLVIGIAVLSFVVRFMFGMIMLFVSGTSVALSSATSRSFESGLKNAMPAIVVTHLVLSVIWFVISLFMTKAFLEYAGSTEFVDYLNPHNFFAWVGVLGVINGLALKKTDSNNND